MSFKVIVVLHNVHSVLRVMDMARLVYGIPLAEMFIISKASGAAAQTGIPEVHKLAYRLGKPLLCVPDLEDAVSLMNPSEILLVDPSGERELDRILNNIVHKLSESNETVMIVFSGSDTYFTKQEKALGKIVYFNNLDRPLGCIAEAAIFLHELLKKLKKVHADHPN